MSQKINWLRQSQKQGLNKYNLKKGANNYNRKRQNNSSKYNFKWNFYISTQKFSYPKSNQFYMSGTFKSSS